MLMCGLYYAEVERSIFQLKINLNCVQTHILLWQTRIDAVNEYISSEVWWRSLQRSGVVWRSSEEQAAGMTAPVSYL